MERGGVRSKWVEKGGEVVKKAESAGELVKKGGEVVKKAESAGKLGKKGGASRGMGGLLIPSQTERANRNEDKNDGQE